ncbi:ribosome maturation factor RimM [Anaerococcus sp. NML200537]|uniref:ribosome maturation factor RimM n=1 Tax=Anaerococcus sp. NML200537 TaxID=2954485 RepID=UPI002237A6D7|nr:ribosome maturation factor RimM [Anaerococcus sp. NML200537]MCW6701023.1 ribosome maturation factor RimM [Anaerococcus sp. NML200537]
MRISVGEIVKAQGIRGEIKVKSLSDNEERFKIGSKLFIGNEIVTIKRSYKQKNMLILGFEEYDNINDILKFIGKDLTIDEKDLGKLNEDEIYIKDLYGLSVTCDGQKVGEIKDVISGVYPNDIYVIKTDRGEVLLPAIKNTIKEINTEKGFIEVENFSDYE